MTGTTDVAATELPTGAVSRIAILLVLVVHDGTPISGKRHALPQRLDKSEHPYGIS